MKSILYLIGGMGLAAAYIFARRRQEHGMTPQEPVAELAHRLQDAWADHHTIA